MLRTRDTDIKSEENELFTRWQKAQNYRSFIKDGVFDPAEWAIQSVKILYVLKEANWEDGNVDLCEYLLSEQSATYWKTWNNIARWTKALLEQGEYPKKVSKADKTFWLKKTAFLNLKKAGGGSASDDAVIREYALRDKEYILKQIDLYQPDIIICCGRGEGKNADILHDIVFPESSVSKWQEPIRTYNYFFYRTNEKQIPVVSFYHPQIRGGHDRLLQLYEDMMVLGKELLRKGTGKT